MSQDYSADIVPVVVEVGKKLKENYGNAKTIKQKSRGPTDLVTEMDSFAEKTIREHLAKEYPDIEFYGEETGGNLNAERFWLLDPIDGTAHYVRGNPFCTTMLALIEGGQPTFSVIHDFVREITYVAQKGKGATMNGEPIHVSQRSLAEAYLAYEVDFSKGDNLQKWLGLQGRCILMNTINTGYEFALVASGKLEGRICLNAFGGIYDFAPGAFLVQEAGGVVRTVGSTTYDYRNFTLTATNPQVYDDLLRLKIIPEPR